MVVGLLAILKAGGAYLPLDTNYPAERLAFMVEDAAPLCLLTDKASRPPDFRTARPGYALTIRPCLPVLPASRPA